MAEDTVVIVEDDADDTPPPADDTIVVAPVVINDDGGDSGDIDREIEMVERVTRLEGRVSELEMRPVETVIIEEAAPIEPIAEEIAEEVVEELVDTPPEALPWSHKPWFGKGAE